MKPCHPIPIPAETRIKRLTVIALMAWTVLLSLSLWWNRFQVENAMVESARIQARGNFMKDVIYRRWNSMHGGVYVPVTKWTPPNPYLDDSVERDVRTTTGKKLTMVNPAYMTRQAFELGLAEYGMGGHITSLNPIRPQNAADPWESAALRSFEHGNKEVNTVETIDGQQFLRLMRPLVTEKSCLGCHARQGYRLNEIRGGISVTVPMQPFQVIARMRITHLAWAHAALWLIGVGGILFAGLRLANSQMRRDEAEARLRDAYADLERQVSVRTSELKLAVESLNDEKTKFQVLIDESPFAVALIDQGQCFRYLNPRFEQVFGYSLKDLTNRHDWFEKAYPDPAYRDDIMASWQQAEQRANPGLVRNKTLRVRCKNGSDKWARISTAFLASGERIVTYEDVTEQYQMEERLRQAQKMEAIGTLAGGIAHDFNNILSAIIGYAEIVQDDTPAESTTAGNINEVIRAALRARNLVKHILDFSRQSRPEKKPIDLYQVVKEALSLLKATVPATIEIQQDIKPSGVILADSNQMHQVVMNLCTNACQAMAMKHGTLEIRLRTQVLTAEEITQYPDLTPGHYVQLSVSDTGCGMSPDILQRIFDPYFTTKPLGEGTGLGLAVIHGIVTSHGGTITVYSESGKGSTFRVYLPLIDSDAAMKEEMSPPALPRGSERILFVDDEPALAALGKKMLSGLGYRVETRANGSEALELIHEAPEAFDLLITDMTMPHMSGMELAGEVLRLRPDMPILLCTGFSHTITGPEVKKLGICELILKPLIRRELSAAVRKVLDEKSSNPAANPQNPPAGNRPQG